MKVLLVSVNAKFIHTNLAIRSLKKYCESKIDINIFTSEFTINQQPELILREILKQNPDVIGFSCYIWNYEIIKNLSKVIKKLCPEIFIFFGGPEVSFNPNEVLIETKGNCVLCGEGEVSFTNLISELLDNSGASEKSPIEKIMYAKPCNLDDINFVYEDGEFSQFKDRIIYYEASRGCPFNCQYCLSGASYFSANKATLGELKPPIATGGKVRTLSLERVFKDLMVFIKANLKQVKFVDRTFNFDKKYAMEIWKFISENCHTDTNFHFEIAAELIDDEMLDFLSTVKSGLFQFEIGVQSTNPQTLKAVKRNTDTALLVKIVGRLQEKSNIHLHLDLIAGLPFEGYNSFKNSFNFVHSLNPNQLQLGFLKLLKGSGLYENRQKYGLVCTDYAPYEVLKTDWLSYKEVLNLKMIEEMVELYYNSNRFDMTVKYLRGFFETAFDFYESLACFFEKNNFHLAPQNKVFYYTILYKFYCEINSDKKDDESFFTFARFDSYSYEKAKKLPDWLPPSLNEKYKKSIFEFMENKENLCELLDCDKEFLLQKNLRSLFNSVAHIEVFLQNPFTSEKLISPILFSYNKNKKAKIIKL